jgi:hypothetical protein
MKQRKPGFDNRTIAEARSGGWSHLKKVVISQAPSAYRMIIPVVIQGTQAGVNACSRKLHYSRLKYPRTHNECSEAHTARDGLSRQ